MKIGYNQASLEKYATPRGGLIFHMARFFIFFVIFLSACTKMVAPESTPTEAPLSVGKILYVSVDGNDMNPGTLIKPLQNIQACLDRILPGDACEIMTGTYYESIVLRTTGAENARITLKNHPGHLVTINSGDEKSLITDGRINFYTIEGLRFVATNISAEQGDYTIDFGHDVWDGETNKDGGNNGFILRNCYVEGAVRFYGHNNLVENCELNGSNNWINGLVDQFAASHDNIYRNNTIYNYAFRGIWSMSYTDNITIEGNTVYHNGGGGIDCDGAAYPVTRCIVRNNIIHDVGGEGVGIWFENCFDCEANGNTIYEVVIGIETINYGLTSNYDFILGEEYRTTNTNLVVSNNTIYDIRRDGILCLSAPGATVMNNIIRRTNYATTEYFAAIALSQNTDYFCHNWNIVGNNISQSQKAYWFDSPIGGLSNLVIDNNTYDYKSTDIKYYWRTYTSQSSSTNEGYSLVQMQLMGLELNSITTYPESTVFTHTLLVPDWMGLAAEHLFKGTPND